MPWNTPPTFTAGQVVTASDLNSYLRDNPNYLFGGPTTYTVKREGTADYTITSTSFVDVDATNLIITANVQGGKFTVIAEFFMEPTGTSPQCEADIILDSTTRFGSTHGTAVFTPARWGHVTLVAFFTGLSAGSHTFKLQARVTGASMTCTVYNNARPISMIGWGN